MTEQEARAAIVAEARKWIGARWHHGARVRYVACDCGMLIADVFDAAGAVAFQPIGPYSRQHPLHSSEERFLAVVECYAKEIEGQPLPGDIVVWRFGRAFSHGGIVVDWPWVIHAYTGEGVVLCDTSMSHLSRRAVKFFSVFGGEHHGR